MDDTLSTLFCIVIPIAAVVHFFYQSAQKSKRIREAERVYNEHLAAFRRSPTDSRIRKQTHTAGRAYSRAAREGGKETLFDEMALRIDIDAIAGALVSKPPPKPPPAPPQSSAKSHEERLLALDDLRRKGLITDEEYNQRRFKILDEIY